MSDEIVELSETEAQLALLAVSFFLDSALEDKTLASKKDLRGLSELRGKLDSLVEVTEQ